MHIALLQENMLRVETVYLGWSPFMQPGLAMEPLLDRAGKRQLLLLISSLLDWDTRLLLG